MASTYRQRLRLEGLTLAAAGAAGSVLLLTTQPQARRSPWNTAGQLAAVAAGLGVLGPRSTDQALAGSRRIWLRRVGSGEPTPLWHVPAVVTSLTLSVSNPVGLQPGHRLLKPLLKRAGWDAGLRVTLGCALVGLYQALVIERRVGAHERRRRRTFYRRPGSRLGRGTELGWTRF